MRMNFATSLLAGVLLAAVLVVASSYGQGPAATLAPEYTTVGSTRATTQTMTATSLSTTTQAAGSISIPSTVSGLTTSASENYTFNGAAQSSVSSLSASLGGPPSSLAALVKQPTSIPLLLLPVALAIILGLALYKGSNSED